MDEILGITPGSTFVDAVDVVPAKVVAASRVAPENTAAVDDFASSTDEIEHLKRSRAAKMAEQERVEATRSAFCDKIRALKEGQFPTLEKRIRMLEITDIEMFKYIRYLERVQYMLKQSAV